MCNHYNTESAELQVKKLLQKLEIKKSYNNNVINWCRANGLEHTADNISDCGTFVGITDVSGIQKIVKANFCRERICFICAWRRQAKFISQTLPMIEIMSNDYEFLFATLTIKNVCYDELKNAVDTLLKGFNKLMKRKEIKYAWQGVIRSLELTYNHTTDTYHPHIHLLIAVSKDYFNNNYISQNLLSVLWEDVCVLDYTPIVDIRKVTDKKAVTETLKYSLKPSKHNEALKAFYYILKGRRLISFTGVFAKLRKELKYSDFMMNLTDEDKIQNNSYKYNLYRFDSTGGIYSFYKQYEIEGAVI